MHVWDKWAKCYERLWVQNWVLTPSRLAIRDHVRRVCPRAGRVLDVGCGIGQLARELADDEPGREIVALDTSAGMIERAESMTDADGRITYAQSSLADLDGESFDLIVSTNALPYIPDQMGALRKMRALLRPGGRALVLHANANRFYDRFVLTIVKATVGRAHYLPSDVLEEYMRQAGFAPVAVLRVPMHRLAPSVHMVEGLTRMALG